LIKPSKHSININGSSTPKECVFRVPSVILLGNVVSRDGISLVPSKVKAILDMRPPRKVKDVQKLTSAWLPSAVSYLG
jgi:hypothetical protein